MGLPIQSLLILAASCTGVKESTDCESYTFEAYLSDYAEQLCANVQACDRDLSGYEGLTIEECEAAARADHREAMEHAMEIGCGEFSHCDARACVDLLSTQTTSCERWGCDADSTVLTPGCDTAVAR
jgi:hypothetical protein